MKRIFIALTLAALFSQNILKAQDAPAAETKAEESAPAPVVPAVKPLPPFDLVASKVYANGELFSTLIKINTGKEFVSLSVPAAYRFQSSASGREITVYVDESRKNWVKFQFYTNSFAELTREAVWPLIEDDFGGSPTVFSTGRMGEKTVLGFTAKTGTTNNPKQLRTQIIPCEGGTLLASTVAYGSSAEFLFFKMKQLVGSLQFAKTEKELLRTEPSSQD